MNFTFEETNLLCIYHATSDGTRMGLIAALGEMQQYLEPEEQELSTLTASALEKLRNMTEEAFSQLEWYPDFEE